MKIIFTSIFSLLFLVSHCQPFQKKEPPIQIVNRNFKVYKSTADNSPSWKIKKEMLDALTELQQSVNDKDLPVLVNVWMYYDPTDFPTRSLIEPIFFKHKMAALNAVNKRLLYKKKWEDKDKAPYSELIALQKQLSK
jgi:hypothetical protein